MNWQIFCQTVPESICAIYHISIQIEYAFIPSIMEY